MIVIILKQMDIDTSYLVEGIRLPGEICTNLHLNYDTFVVSKHDF